jgi:adenylate kinase
MPFVGALSKNENDSVFDYARRTPFLIPRRRKMYVQSSREARQLRKNLTARGETSLLCFFIFIHMACKKCESQLVSEARTIMEGAWSSILKELGEGALVFPREIFWLNGAPGAGKGTQTDFIMKCRGLSFGPVVISDLLQSPGAKKLKDAGLMVGDSEVIGLMLRALLDPALAAGVIVDGFPRTAVQAECLKILSDNLKALHAKDEKKYPAPIFRIVVLLVSEKTSVDRQLSRGIKAKTAGEAVRKTDTDPEAARARFTTSLEVTHEPLKNLQGVFPYHLIDSEKSVEEVQELIRKELGKA